MDNSKMGFLRANCQVKENAKTHKQTVKKKDKYWNFVLDKIQRCYV